jgi:hypothetical protein
VKLWEVERVEDGELKRGKVRGEGPEIGMTGEG